MGVVDFHIIDDNDAIVSFATAVLKSEGYSCLGFISSRDYLQQLQSGALALPKCVITDLSMPELGGRQLMAEVMTLCPDQRFIVMTGFADEALDKREACIYLGKPFRVETLLDAVRVILHCEQHGPSRQHGCESMGDTDNPVTEWDCSLDSREHK